MNSGLSEDEKRRIETFCETPPYERSPEDLTPSEEYADEVGPTDESERSMLTALWTRLSDRLSIRVSIPQRRANR